MVFASGMKISLVSIRSLLMPSIELLNTQLTPDVTVLDRMRCLCTSFLSLNQDLNCLGNIIEEF